MLRRVRARSDDRGFTLTELLVAMTVFGICVAMVFGAVILVVRKMDDAQKSADAVFTLRQAVAQIDRQVRSGNVLYSPASEATAGCFGNPTANSGNCMRIFTQSNGSEKCVQWQVLDDPGQPGSKLLRSRSWEPMWTTTGNVTGWSIVARGLRLDATNPFTLNGALTPYKERLLDVRLLAYDARTRSTVSVQSSLAGRNTSYGYTGTDCTPVPLP